MTDRTEHPAKGCTKAQVEAFEQIAVNWDGGHHPKTLAALERKGLIERGPDRVLGHDALGAIVVPSYRVPFHLHYQWCKWASENVEDEDIMS